MSSADCTRKLCLVIGSVMPWMSASWKASVPIAGAGHLAGDRDHRHRVHVRVGDRRDQVGRARAGGGHADADLAGGLRVAGGGVPGALLVADQDVAHLRVEERVVRRQDRAAGDAEHDLDPERLERPDERLRPGSAGPAAGYGRRGRAGGGGGGADRLGAAAGAVGEGLGRGSRHGGSGLRHRWLVCSDRGASSQQKSPRARCTGPAHSRSVGECAQVSTRQTTGTTTWAQLDASHADESTAPTCWVTGRGVPDAVRPADSGPAAASVPAAAAAGRTARRHSAASAGAARAAAAGRCAGGRGRLQHRLQVLGRHAPAEELALPEPAAGRLDHGGQLVGSLMPSAITCSPSRCPSRTTTSTIGATPARRSATVVLGDQAHGRS